MRISIAAHREDAGDIIWGCWQPGLAGTTIGDVRRINSGAMLIMMNPRGADTIAKQIAQDASDPKGPMQPWHFDLALKSFLEKPKNNRAGKACYVFPPIGNYTQHVSGCDPKFSKGAGRPNCWSESWACPGTTVDEDPQKRPKRLLAWNGANKHTDLGSAAVDAATGCHLEWRSFWHGESAPPAYRTEEQRRPQKILKRPASARSGGVEPAATSTGSQGKGAQKGKGAPTTQSVVSTFGGSKGQGKEPPYSLWPERPGLGEPPLDSDPVEQWDDDHNEEQGPTRTTKRQRRNIRTVLLNRSFRNWVPTVWEVIL